MILQNPCHQLMHLPGQLILLVKVSLFSFQFVSTYEQYSKVLVQACIKLSAIVVFLCSHVLLYACAFSVDHTYFNVSSLLFSSVFCFTYMSC